MVENEFFVRDFVFAVDDGYALPLRVAVGSLLNACRKNGNELVVHVIDLGISDSNWIDCVISWERLMPSVEIVRHRVDSSRYAGLRQWRGSVATYARVDIPELLPDVNWCINFDADTMIIEDPRILSTYCDERFAIVGKALGENIFDAFDGRWLDEKGIVYDREHYVCAGVMLMNLALLRKIGASRKCMEFLSHYPDAITLDQTAINCVCVGRVGLLPSTWGLGSDETMKSDQCACVHFAGVVPWRKMSCLDIPFFCGEHELAEIWRRLAIEKLGVPPKILPNLSWRKTWLPRIFGFVAWNILSLAALLRVYPKRFACVAESVRKRRSCASVSRIRAQVLGL